MDVRCQHKKHAELVENADGELGLEVKCRSALCGAGPGVVVIHRFDPCSGKLLGTERYAEPPLGGTTQ